jgi:SPP1 family predicted phage head-tail adaptor
MGVLRSGDLNRRIRFQRPVEAEGFKSAGKTEWQDVATVWAQVQDMLPSRGERMVAELQIALRPARVRVRYRSDITADMRILTGGTVIDDQGNPVWRTDRIMQIVTPPIELGRREGLEMMAQDYSTSGGAA